MAVVPPKTADCPFCGHRFHPGAVVGRLYCPKCGGRFHPNADLNETVALVVAPAPASSESDPDIDPGGPAATPATPDGKAPLYPPRDPGAAAGPDARAGHALDGEPGKAGERFGDYDLLAEIARGGMGVVYRAWQRSLRRVVALKLLRAGDGAGPEERERLLREASAAAGLSHPNIVPVHEFSVFQGRPYFTMDLVEGRALDRKLENGPLPPVEACRLIETVARAIDYAHHRGIVHRDLKPANIIMDADGEPRVTDFGLAVRLGPDPLAERMTRDGSVMGTIPYIPPEQAAGRVDFVNELSDVYSLGAVLYECVTGHPPFSGETQFELLRRVIHQEPAPPRHLNPRLHRDVETIILTCLEKDPARRYPSAAAMADDCRAFLGGEVISARPASRMLKLWRWTLRHKALAALAATALLLLLSFGQLRRVREAGRTARNELVVMTEAKTRLEEEVDRQLRRPWRGDYALSFGPDFRSAPTPVEARRHMLPWVDPQRNRLEDGMLRLLPGPDPEQPSLGLPLAYPHDFRLTATVRIPDAGDAGLTLWVDADRGYQPSPDAIRIDLGSAASAGFAASPALTAPASPTVSAPNGGATPSTGSAGLPPASTAPGAVISRNRAELAAHAAFAWKPGATAEFLVERDEGRWSVKVDGQEILNLPPSSTIERGEGYLAFAAAGSGFGLARLLVQTRGLSGPMIDSMLEFGRQLLSQGEGALAMPLYARILGEPTGDAIHLRALRGFAQACAGASGDNWSVASGWVRDFSEKRPALVPPAPGEDPYLLGLIALAMAGGDRARPPSDFADRLRRASDNFAGAVVEARSHGPSLSFGSWERAGPFRGDHALAEPFPPETTPSARAYETGDGIVEWEAFGRADRQGEELTAVANADQEADAVYYARRVFQVGTDMAATLSLEADIAPGVWLNGRLLAAAATATAEPSGPAFASPLPGMTAAPGRPGGSAERHQWLETVALAAGANTVVLKFPAAREVRFRLRLMADDTRHAGLYGQLASLERNLIGWRAGNDAMAAADLLVLSEGGVLTSLRERALGEALSQTMSALLETSDRRLRQTFETPESPDAPAPEALAGARASLAHAMVLATAARSLGGDAREVAQRFWQIAAGWQRWAPWLPEGAGQARAAFDRAHRLAPDWSAPWIDEARLAGESGGAAMAAEVWDRATAALPQAADLWLAQARYWLDEQIPGHNPARSLASASAADAAGGGAAALEWKARALRALGRLEEAERAAAAGLILEPNETLATLLREIQTQRRVTTPASPRPTNPVTPAFPFLPLPPPVLP